MAVRKDRKEYKRAYREANRDKVAARSQTYYQNNREQYADRRTKRRALKRGATVEKVSRKEVYERDNGRCHICGKKVSKKSWHLDHLIPLIKGGEHSYRNVAVSCPKCNMSKGIKAGAQLRIF